MDTKRGGTGCPEARKASLGMGSPFMGTRRIILRVRITWSTASMGRKSAPLCSTRNWRTYYG